MNWWTFLYRPDNGKFIAVVDLREWRESSRSQHGFATSKVREIAERPLTKEESEDYGVNVWRYYSCSYNDPLDLLADELRITENPTWIEKLKAAIESI